MSSHATDLYSVYAKSSSSEDGCCRLEGRHHGPLSLAAKIIAPALLVPYLELSDQHMSPAPANTTLTRTLASANRIASQQSCEKKKFRQGSGRGRPRKNFPLIFSLITTQNSCCCFSYRVRTCRSFFAGGEMAAGAPLLGMAPS